MESNCAGTTQSRHLGINESLNSLDHEIVMLERLLEEIQGSDDAPKAPGEPSVHTADRPVALMIFLRDGSDRIVKLTERMVVARNEIRESIF